MVKAGDRVVLVEAIHPDWLPRGWVGRTGEVRNVPIRKRWCSDFHDGKCLYVRMDDYKWLV